MYVSVFLTGAILLILELLGLRLLTPYFGNTSLTTSSILSTVLGGLAIGYWIGGKLGKVKEPQKVFFGLIIISGVLIALLNSLYTPILQFITANSNNSLSTVLAASVLFLIPCTIFGVISPLAIIVLTRAASKTVATSVGNMYSISTLGSIVGSLLTGYVLIPHFGLNDILKVLSIILLLIGSLGLAYGSSKRFQITTFVIALLLSLLLSLQLNPNNRGVVATVNGEYATIQVIDGTFQAKSTRFFVMDRQNAAAKYINEPNNLVYDYTKAFDSYSLYGVHPKKIAVIGGAAYTLPQAYIQNDSTVNIDVFVLEPKTIEVANQYFGGAANNPRIRTFLGDARIELAKHHAEYDAIFLDAYNTPQTIPWQLSTREFYAEVNQALTDNGVIISNIISTTRYQQAHILGSLYQTQSTEFSNFFAFATELTDKKTTNALLLASKKTPFSLRSTKYFDTNYYTSHSIDLTSLTSGIVLTDNYAPLEHLAFLETVETLK